MTPRKLLTQSARSDLMSMLRGQSLVPQGFTAPCYVRTLLPFQGSTSSEELPCCVKLGQHIRDSVPREGVHWRTNKVHKPEGRPWGSGQPAWQGPSSWASLDFSVLSRKQNNLHCSHESPVSPAPWRETRTFPNKQHHAQEECPGGEREATSCSLRCHLPEPPHQVLLGGSGEDVQGLPTWRPWLDCSQGN